jgi:DNA helicase II / ATP-dependent DNA helicase PcrA
VGSVDRDLIFDGLNPEQRRAVEAVRGPVVILAGAGSGKTTTITRRIAWQVASGAFAAGEILAVTFTDKAAGEMRARLERLGVDGVRARTFHASALQQLHYFARGPGGVLPSKALMLRHIANSLPRPYRFRPAADIATDIEWAKNRRIPADRYEELAADRAGTLPPDLMGRVYREYEKRKAARGLADFEDLLELCIRMYDDDANALAQFRSRCRAVTVDEFQDVNQLQQELLERWLGQREELCVVGDDYQAIYGFTGASPLYLLALRDRFASATVVTLEANYRSSPEVLELANRLTPRLGGAPKTLRAVCPDGPGPEVRPFPTREEETAAVVARIHELAGTGVPHDGMAILFRLNARSEPWEEALAAAEIPYQVRGGPFLARPAARRLRQVLGGSASTAVADHVRRAAVEEGWAQGEELERVGEYEATRQHDLGRLVAIARQLDDGLLTLAGFFTELDARFGDGSDGQGVHLLTYHRAKGLEFDAVFLPGVEERELPVRQAKTEESVAEERRLLYVGITRAKRHLLVSWSAEAKPSRFLAELGVEVTRVRERLRIDAESLPPSFTALREWRLKRAKEDGVPAYVVFHDSTLAEIAERAPTTRGELATVSGVGPAKLERYADDVLAALAAAP